MIYFVLVLFILFMQIMSYIVENNTAIIKKEKFHEIFFVIVFMVMALVCGLRSRSVGADTWNYERIFYRIGSYSFYEIFSSYKYNSVEIGWNVMCKLIYMVKPDYYVFQIIESFLFCFGFMIFIKNNVKDYNLATWVFLSLLYLYNFNVSRQMLAVMFTVNSFQYLFEKKMFKAFIMVFLGFLFHASAIVFFAAFPIYYMFKFKQLRKFLFAILIIVALTFNDIFKYLRNNWLFLKLYFGDYLSNDREIQTAGLIRILWIIVCFMAIYELISDRTENRQKNKIAAIFSMFWVAANVIGLGFNYFQRVGWYFEPFVIILFDNVLTLINKYKTLKTIYYLGSVLCLIAYFLLASHEDLYLSYSFLFNK